MTDISRAGLLARLQGQWISRWAMIKSIFKAAFGHGDSAIIFEPGDPFRRAGRNLLWAATATLAFAFVKGPSVSVPGLGESIAMPTGGVALGLLAYTVYLALRFFHETGTVVVRHSPAGLGEDIESARKVVRDLQTRVADISADLSSYSSALADFETMESSHREARMEMLAELEATRAKVPNAIQFLREKVSFLHFLPDKQDVSGTGLNQSLTSEMSVKLETVARAASHWTTVLHKVDTLTEDYDPEEIARQIKLSGDYANRLGELEASLALNLERYLTIATDLAGRDRRMFARWDVLFPVAITALALLATAVAHRAEFLPFLKTDVPQLIHSKSAVPKSESRDAPPDSPASSPT